MEDPRVTELDIDGQGEKALQTSGKSEITLSLLISIRLHMLKTSLVAIPIRTLATAITRKSKSNFNKNTY